VARRRGEFGTLYRGREGQWAWVLHRVTGVGITLFLFAHVVDTAVVGWGPDAYNRVVAVYHNPLVQMLELALVGMVVYHAYNGIRIMIVDFWPKATVHHVKLFWGTMALFVASMIPITWIIGRNIIRDI
jgi:succinate dehydrogenase / fumarate reductase cytochrome b subunit